MQSLFIWNNLQLVLFRHENLTNFHKYTRFRTILETIKFDWNKQTNQYNSHLELFLDLQKVYQSNHLWLCIFTFQIYLNEAIIWNSTQKIAVILPGIFHNQKKFPRPWVTRSRLLSCLGGNDLVKSVYCEKKVKTSKILWK